MGHQYYFSIPIDEPGRASEHKRIIQSKKFLKKLYLEWYGTFINEMASLPPGPVVEIGSGGGFLKEEMPSIVTSDILQTSENDLCFSALDMPFENNSVSGLLMLDVFHHLPDAQRFLSEANRVLKKNGKLLLIEPATSKWGKLVFSKLHHEPFILKGSWQIPDSGPLSGANIALPWIVFMRDKEIFKEEFPELMIEEIKYHTPLRYILSGGLSYKQLVPDFTFGFFSLADRILASMSRHFSMFMTLKIRKI